MCLFLGYLGTGGGGTLGSSVSGNATSTPEQTSNRSLSSSVRRRQKNLTLHFVDVRSEILVSFLPSVLLM